MSFFMPPSEWRKPRGGQRTTWYKGVKENTKSLGVVGAVHLSGWGSHISVNTNISDDDDEGRKHTVLPIITRKFWVFCERHFHQKGTGYSTIRTHTNPYTIRLEKGYQGGTQHCIVCTDVHSWATCLKAVSTRQRRSVTYYVTNEVAPEKECNTTAASIWNRNKQLKFIRTPGRQVSLSAVVNSSHSSVMSFMFQRHEIIIMVASRIIMHGFWSSSKLAY
ncbi:hypothetical protein CSKR_101809 [Clonorchis sinensis]|uniref:Uncharacterized protein n=1 Tax=Clonorchis sinensis TaxID=79923 RepID=A0A3R7D910_CLOSI|nr:hypothetical protein CSKR_101809 [Clonorchis sinensis]